MSLARGAAVGIPRTVHVGARYVLVCWVGWYGMIVRSIVTCRERCLGLADRLTDCDAENVSVEI